MVWRLQGTRAESGQEGGQELRWAGAAGKDKGVERARDCGSGEAREGGGNVCVCPRAPVLDIVEGGEVAQHPSAALASRPRDAVAPIDDGCDEVGALPHQTVPGEDRWRCKDHPADAGDERAEEDGQNGGDARSKRVATKHDAVAARVQLVQRQQHLRQEPLRRLQHAAVPPAAKPVCRHCALAAAALTAALAALAALALALAALVGWV